MTTHIHTRHRRLLSMQRRGGAQVSPDVLQGRTSRHAQGWSDEQRRIALEAEDKLLALVGWAALGWAGFALLAWLAMSVF